jgi:hypothetical protein
MDNTTTASHPGDWTGRGYAGGQLAELTFTHARTDLEHRWEAAERAISALSRSREQGGDALRALRDLRAARVAFDLGRLVTARHRLAALNDWLGSSPLNRNDSTPGAELPLAGEPSFLAHFEQRLAEPLAGAALFAGGGDQGAVIKNFCEDVRLAVEQLPPLPGSLPTTGFAEALQRQQRDVLTALQQLEEQVQVRTNPVPLRLLRRAGLLNTALARIETALL